VGVIRQLPDLLVNKIAAGEVVERPASVVKELIENSLDAGATRISVTIEEGGQRLIRVADNGSGIAAGEIHLAVSAHATSKLADEDALFAIGTLGFRGEALASIGSVSNLLLSSRTPDSDAGAEVRVIGSRIKESTAVGRPPGTTVEVRDLFFNVPARRKFLRTKSTETARVTELFTRLALAHPRIAFDLTKNGRTSHSLPGEQTTVQRIGSFFGPELADELMHFQRTEHGLEIEGYAAPPARARATGNWQYLFVNGRWIRDRMLQFAMREAYRGLMEHDRFPVAFVSLSLDTAGVAVNVHPTKIEVRWRDGSAVRSQVLSALRETLQAADLTPALRASSPHAQADESRNDQLRHEAAAWFKRQIPAPASGAGGTAASTSAGSFPRSGAPGERTTVDPYRSTGSPSASDSVSDRSRSADGLSLWRSYYGDSPSPDMHQPELEGMVRRAPGRALQLHNTYLVTETEEGLLIIDQHALHERVIYEELRQRITRGALESQRLLLPETLAVTPAQMSLLETHRDLLHRLGMEVSPFGPDTVAIQAFPSLLADTSARRVLGDLLDKLAEDDGAGDVEVLVHKLLDMMACKAAVKAGDPLTPEEIDALIAQRGLVEKSSNCPHGRPTTLSMSVKELDKQFKRR